MESGRLAGPFRWSMPDDSNDRRESHRLYRVRHFSHVNFLPAAIQEQFRMAMVLGQSHVEHFLVNEEIPPQNARADAHQETEQDNHPIPEIGIAPYARTEALVIAQRNRLRRLRHEKEPPGLLQNHSAFFVSR